MPNIAIAIAQIATQPQKGRIKLTPTPTPKASKNNPIVFLNPLVNKISSSFLTNNVNCCKMTTIYYVIGELM
jgi:hypothetical protein